ncbi:MAG: hypothetical protein DWQ09_17290 [Proteobacteria bacterium]|nr:MAG: hypothetical protein DWQ09_17290 [Pseudomonadota bacterium]QKK12053.1 MAG: hypothetical protein HND59_11165 [Pseudomonadota bacterium]
MQLDHVCIAVRNLDHATKRLCELFGYRVKTDKVTNSRQEVNIQFLVKEDSLDIKLIEPSHRDSPLVDFLKRGEGLHHLCFKGGDTVAEVQALAAKGARVLAAPQPGEAFDDALIAFVYAGMGLNVEVIDTDKRRGLRD